MRRNIFYTAILAGTLMISVGCKGGSSNTANAERAAETTTAAAASAGASANTGAEHSAPDGHSARTSLDYTGTYRGVLSAPDIGDITLDLTLKEDTYTLEIKVMDESINSITNTYKWDDAGRTITLNYNPAASPLTAMLNIESIRIMVAENALHILNRDGKRATGEGADRYTFTKISD